ncbi:MAG: class I SAM-dependent methyltransferase [Candidatus Bathyarchaeota archaeon]|nr:MAG: class I SAM-dependent methyltransferase [Candidatus Bathyarchaeota archaeon]
MNPEQDAFGQKLLAAYKGEEVYEIMERDDGYIEAMGIKGYFSDFKDWDPVEQKAMKFVKGRVLDIGCGAGRHALYLQKEEIDVTGIDISPLTVKVCMLRGLRKVSVMSIEEMNFKPSSFDTIIMMGNNFGLLGSFKKATSLLGRLHIITTEKALIVASTRDPYKTENSAHLAYHKLNKVKGRMGGQVRIRSRFRQYTGEWFDYIMVSQVEMKQILAGTGWRIRELLDSENSGYIAIIEKR